MAIPKLRSGSYFPVWLLERRRRAEAALTSVVATCYLLGVSTRRMEKLVETLGITRLSRSQVSEMARDLDEQVEALAVDVVESASWTSPPPAVILAVERSGATHLLIGSAGMRMEVTFAACGYPGLVICS